MSPFAYYSNGILIDTCAEYYMYGKKPTSSREPDRILLGCRECADGYEPEDRVDNGKTDIKLVALKPHAIKWDCVPTWANVDVPER